MKGHDGENGGEKKQQGRNGDLAVVLVPLGTVVWIREGAEWRVLDEFCEEGQDLCLARGGGGGRGNVRFATATNKAPRLAEEGVVGEEQEILLELCVMADVALIGPPNTGRSLLLRRISNAVPSVAQYAFTTWSPVLGVVEHNSHSFTIVELPGLVKDAYQGKGLGSSFLRHLRRIRLIVYVLDGATEDLGAVLREIRTEVGCYDPAFLARPQLVVVNKMDLPTVQQRLPELRRQMASQGLPVYLVSALTEEGIGNLVTQIVALLERHPPASVSAYPVAIPQVFTPRSHKPVVTLKGDVFVVSSERAERLVRLPDLRQFQVRLQLRAELAKLGVVRALEEAGVQPGDRVRIGPVELQWE